MASSEVRTYGVNPELDSLLSSGFHTVTMKLMCKKIQKKQLKKQVYYITFDE